MTPSASRGALAWAILCTTLFSTGCPKTGTPGTPPSGPDWAATPRLPAPVAGAYARSAEAPSDPALATLVDGHRWDATLSGAATGLALTLIDDSRASGEGPGITRWRVREALWRAGYPHPVQDVKAWGAMPDGSPPPQLVQWLQTLGPEDDLGLVRARGDESDLWVALRARPAVEIERIPRQLPEGGTLELSGIAGARYRVADANGRLQEGALDESASLAANTIGEWMVSIEPADGEPALFPVYVGIVPPELPLIRSNAPVSNAAEVLARAEALLEEVRDTYGAPQLQRDFVLDAGASSLLRGDASSAEGVQSSLGLDPEGTTIFVCRGTTVEACIDRMNWRPENRRALLADESALGLAADLDAKGAHVVGILSVTH